MNIEGLDYNTQREKLVMPEYGREVQNMVDYAMTLESKQERQRCANTIIKVMGQMVPKNKESIDHERKLWDHLAIMSGFKLDIDYPYDVSGALKIATKPEPMEYPMQKIPVRHYGKMMFELFEKLKTMPAGKERDQLTCLTANQMKHNLSQWGHGSNDDEKIASDLARFTDGVIQLDLATFKFDTQYQQKQPVQPQQSKKRKRK
ncbi:MAG: DUF4290 domain-containing protein [Prevotella sp.]|nr:DUF4290 domain-containing protein [Prevotella sp.]